jgi:hypothetical protein
MNVHSFARGDGSEQTEVDGALYERGRDGIWRYANSPIKVPGARDLTLTEHFEPKVVMANGRVERVVVAGDDISREPDLLRWVLEVGTAIKGPAGNIEEVFVPISDWEARNRIPHAMVAPEHSDNPAERDLAKAERRVREAEHQLEVAAAVRASVLRHYSDALTRQEARAITDLSVGRIQQLIRGGDVGADEIDFEILGALAARKKISTKNFLNRLIEYSGSPPPRKLVGLRLDALEEGGLIDRKTGFISVTPEGRQTLAAAIASKSRDHTAD